MPHLRVAFCALTLAFLQACATVGPTTQMPSAGPTVNLPPPYRQGNITVVVEQLLVDRYDRVIGVSGTATNNGSVNLLTCNIYLDVIDATGAKVSAAHATMIGLKSGQTWDFQATFATPFETTFKWVEPGSIMARNE
jgi:hypothetical protein